MRITNTIKVFSFITLLMAVIIGISIYSGRTLIGSSKSLENQISEIEGSIKAGGWGNAAASLSKTAEDWERLKPKWYMLTDHMEIDNISSTLARMGRYVEAEDLPSAMAEASSLRQYLRHIPEREILNLENIF